MLHLCRVVSLCITGFFILFSCARVSTNNVIVSKLTIDAYTKERSYAPVKFYLLKTCGRDSLGKTTIIIHMIWYTVPILVFAEDINFCRLYHSAMV